MFLYTHTHTIPKMFLLSKLEKIKAPQNTTSFTYYTIDVSEKILELLTLNENYVYLIVLRKPHLCLSEVIRWTATSSWPKFTSHPEIHDKSVARKESNKY